MNFHRHHRNQGAKVNHTTRSAKSPAAKTGFFATRGASRGLEGSGAPTDGVRARTSLFGLAALTVLAAAAILALGVAPASAARNHVFDHAFGEPGSGPGQLSEPGAVALNETSGTVYVIDRGNSRVERFDGETGAFLGQFNGSATPAGSFENPQGIAVDNAVGSPSLGDVYVADTGHRVIDKFDPNGTYLGQITGTCPAPGTCLPGEVIPFGEILPGVAIDSTGAVFVYQGVNESSTEIDKFSNALTNEPVEAHAVSLDTGSVSPGVAVDSADDVFVNTFFHGVVKLSSSGTVLVQKIGGGERAAGLAIDQADDDFYFGASTEVEVISPSLTTVERFGAPQLTTSAGIAVGASTATAYVSDSTADRVAVFSLEPVAPPLIASESVTGVSATGATLQAEINPRSLAGEGPTTYKFEYDTVPYAEGEAAHGTSVPVPSAQLPAGFGLSGVSVPAEGLAPSTTYHFRVLATNALGTSVGPDRTFTTQPAAASALLPDSRAWELVSPPDKHGTPLSPLSGVFGEGGLIQAAADGDGLTYTASGSITSGPSGNRSPAEEQLLAGRAAAGWSTADITPPNEEPTGLLPGSASQYYSFSTELTRAVVQPKGATPLSPLTTEPTSYLRQPDGSYTPLAIGCPEPPQECPPAIEEHANVVAGVHFGQGGLSPMEFVGASPDLAHLALLSSQPLTPELAGLAAESNLFEWSAGSLQLVSWVPPGSESRCGGTAPACVPAAELGQKSNLGYLGNQVRGAVSADGSRLVFSTDGSSRSRLYLRDTATGETLRLDAAQDVTEPANAQATFQIASTDGSRIFFTDRNKLTPDASPAGNDLYMCQVEETPAGLACDLTDLSANTLDPSEPASVQGNVLGAAADGSSAYFVANGALTAGAVPGDCGGVSTGECNLYRYDTEAGSLHLVAVLSGADLNDWSAGLNYYLANLTSRVSPNGRYLSFMSERPLTGYDNRDAVSGQRDEEVFLYDAAADGGQGKLLCASCNPTGARPRGLQEPTTLPRPLYDSVGNWRTRWLAAAIPGWTAASLVEAFQQSRYLSDSGRLFFNAFDALSPADSNGAPDVYQFEFPQGPGRPSSDTCTTSSAGYSPTTGGCVNLISSGTSGQESAFLDASESGDDVFFLSAARLDPAHDEDGAYDVYDARAPHVPGEPVGFPAPIKAVECSGDACQQPATPPNDPTPGSLTFNGAGNLTECPKGKVKRSGKCVKKHKARKHKKHHKKSHKRANSNRGGQK